MSRDDLQIIYIWNTLKKWKAMILIIVIISVIATAIVYNFAPKQYKAQAKVNLSSLALYIPDDLLDPKEDKNAFGNYAMISFIDFVISDKNLNDAKASAGIADSIVKFREAVQVVKGEQDSSMSIVIINNDPRKAGTAANFLAARLEAYVKDLDDRRLDVFKERLSDAEDEIDSIGTQMNNVQKLEESLANVVPADNNTLFARAQAISAFADLGRLRTTIAQDRKLLEGLIDSQGKTFLSQKATTPDEPLGRSLTFMLILSAIVAFIASLLLAMVIEFISRGSSFRKV